MYSINRRGFIKKSIAGTAGLVTFSSSGISLPSVTQKDNIIFRTLGRTGIKVPVISFGIMRSDNPNLCKAAYDKGIRLFDTANVYQNGNNELMIGNVLKEYPRDSFILATKILPTGVDREGMPTSQTTAEAFLTKFNTSLSRLKMDYVDILYIHNVVSPELLYYKPVVNTVKKLKKEGRVRYIGFSTHQNEPAVIEAAASTETWDVILTAYNFKHAFINELNSSIKKANEAGIGIVAMKTIAGGFLDKEKTRPVNSSAALKWVLSNPDIHTTIPGMTDFDQLDKNMAVMSDLTLTEEEKNDLMAASNETGMYCTGCLKCIPECSRSLRVPDLMRSYMYAYGYSNPLLAHSLLSELGSDDNPCKDCKECSVKCTMNFDIKGKISDISRLLNVPGDFLV